MNYVLLVLGILLLTGVTVFIIRQHKYSKSKHLLASLVFLTAFTGCVVYFKGYYTSDGGFGVVASLLHSVWSSVKMFIFQNDLNDVDPLIKQDSVYMTAFILTHFAAIAISAVLVVSLMGYWLESTVKLFFINKRNKTIHVFMGVSENSLALAKDICKNNGKKNCKDNNLLIFIKLRNDKISSEKYSAKSFFTHFNSNQSEIEQLMKMKALLFVRSNAVEKLLARCPNNAFNFYPLNEEECLNIEKLSYIQTAIEKINPNAADNLYNIYLHSSDNLYSEFYGEHDPETEIAKPYKVHIVNSALLSVTFLKRNARFHPVNCMQRDSKTGTVSSDFTALIVGFSYTGCQALEFLYEFSAFVRPDKQEAKTKIYVVDGNMEALAEDFYFRRPALKNRKDIELINCNSNDAAFYSLLEKIIADLNYTVIATGNDNVSMSIASDILMFAKRKGRVFDNTFRIAVRSYNEENYSNLHVIEQQYKKQFNNCIDIFGTTQEIFTEANVIDRINRKNAVRYNYEYTKVRPEGLKDKDGNVRNEEKLWEEEVVKQDFGYKIQQNMSNSWHKDTKVLLACENGGDLTSQLQGLINDYGQQDYNNMDYYADGLFGNLARTEHIRWVRLMELCGYTCGKGKDYVKKIHKDMVDCSVMDSERRAAIQYDYTVAYVSFLIKAEELQNTIKTESAI
ncbi:MAG: hypothetical protein IJ250_04635 [Bacteroidales bacterium]|nr:hypothetical protein [Bacteroidales bacterium]